MELPAASVSGVAEGEGELAERVAALRAQLTTVSASRAPQAAGSGRRALGAARALVEARAAHRQANNLWRSAVHRSRSCTLMLCELSAARLFQACTSGSVVPWSVLHARCDAPVHGR